MTAIDRAALIEKAAEALEGAYARWSDLVEVGEPVIESEHEAMAAAVVSVVVAAVLKPLRELHRPHPYADAQLRSMSPSLPEFVCTHCTHCATPPGRAVAFPCPTVRLLDQIETDSKGGE